MARYDAEHVLIKEKTTNMARSGASNFKIIGGGGAKVPKIFENFQKNSKTAPSVPKTPIFYTFNEKTVSL